jgi:hypothetical protein
VNSGIYRDNIYRFRQDTEYLVRRFCLFSLVNSGIYRDNIYRFLQDTGYLVRRFCLFSLVNSGIYRDNMYRFRQDTEYLVRRFCLFSLVNSGMYRDNIYRFLQRNFQFLIHWWAHYLTLQPIIWAAYDIVKSHKLYIYSREPGSSVLIEKSDHYIGPRATRLNKINIK